MNERASASMQQGGGLLLKRPRLRKGQRCLNCYRGKAGCSALPCGRCFKLCLQCQPQSALEPGRPFVDIAMSMLETDTFNTDCVEILRRCHRQGYLDRTALRHFVCSWRRMVRVWGGDHTQGLCDAVCSMFNVTTDEMPTHMSRGTTNTRQEKEAAAVLRQQLMGTHMFTLMDDGVSVLVVETVRGDGVTFAMNSASESLLCSDVEADDLLQRYQLLPVHMLACMLDPDDRICLLEAYVNLCSTARRNGCAFVKFCERDGTTDLHILRWRYMQLPDFPESLTVAFTLQRAPETRYLTRRPGHRHFLVEQFVRRRQPHTEKENEDGEHEAADSPSISTLPAFATLPLPPGISIHDIHASVAADITQADAACDRILAGRRKLLKQWANKSSSTPSALTTQECTLPPPPPHPPPAWTSHPPPPKASTQLASMSAPRSSHTPSPPAQLSLPPPAPPPMSMHPDCSSSTVPASALSMFCMASGVEEGAANERLSPLSWSSHARSPFSPLPSRPSSDPPSSCSGTPESASPRPSQFTMLPPHPPVPPPGGLLRLQPFLPRIPLPLQRLPETPSTSPPTPATTSTLALPAVSAVPSSGLVWMISTTTMAHSQQYTPAKQQAMNAPVYGLQPTQTRYVSNAGAPEVQHGHAQQADDEILQAMLELMEE